MAGTGPNGGSTRYTIPQVGGGGAAPNNGQPQGPPGLAGVNGSATGSTNGSGGTLNGQRNSQERKLPAKARVKQQRVPNAYDKTALRLEVSDVCYDLKIDYAGGNDDDNNNSNISRTIFHYAVD